MLLVLVPRWLDLPRPFDLALILGMSLQAWGNVFDLFERFAWYDTVVHVVLTALAAPTLYLALSRLEILPDPGKEHQDRWLLGAFLIVYFMGQGIDAVLVAAGIGAALGGLGLALWTARGWGSVRRVPPEQVRRSG